MIFLGADYRGYFLKEKIKAYLTGRKISWKDLGAYSLKKEDDFIDYAVAVGKAVRTEDLGILVCGSGHGMVMAANKIKGVRAILGVNPKSAKLGRSVEHANILVIASWNTDLAGSKKIITAFLSAKPSKEVRHLRRLRKLKNLEK